MDKPKVTPKDFFLWAGAMVALYGSVIAFITLLFEYINYTFPDPLEYYVDPYSGSIRFAMASLIVLVPLTIVLMRFIRNDITAHAEKAELWVRRWALVLTVFVAGAAVVIDLITLVNYFLGGELSTRFILKVLVLLAIAGGVFLHFLADLRGYWKDYPERAKLVGYASGVMVVIAIISGFFVLGTPGDVRLMRFDNEKISDLQNIQWQVVSYYQQKEVLPRTLEELADPLGGYVPEVDPQSGEAYGYIVTGPLSFELCAVFNAEGDDPYAYPRRPVTSIEGMSIDSWQHPAGEHCYERTIDPERYPPYSKELR